MHARVRKHAGLDQVRLRRAELLVRRLQIVVSEQRDLYRVVDAERLAQLGLDHRENGAILLAVLVPAHAHAGAFGDRLLDVVESGARIDGDARRREQRHREQGPSGRSHGRSSAGTSGMPHFGQFPGAADVTSACIGHT
jgi:hypothetical protein